MARSVEARAWWAEVEDVRERIERRRERERLTAVGARAERSTGVGGSAERSAAGAPAHRRGVREIRPGRRLMLVQPHAPDPARSRRRPRPRAIERVGPHPDRIAAWAVVLGVLMVLAAVLSAH